METNTPLNAPFGWMGGKPKLRATLANLIPEQDTPVKTRKIQRYVEVFGGVAWLLLYKDKWFRNEVYNDINDGLVNLFSVIRFHPDELIKEIELVVNSQKLFHYYKDTLHLTDIQKAAGALITPRTLPKRRHLQRILRKVRQALGQRQYLPLPRPSVLRRGKRLSRH